VTVQIALLLAIITVALVLFLTEWLPADVTALGILLTLVLTGLLPAGDAFAGFGSDAVMMILGLLFLTAALVHTGVVDKVGRVILSRTGDNANRVSAVIMIASAALSAVMSNTATTAFFIPVTIDLARKTRVRVSRLLMPLAFSAILASSLTVVATSTNIVVSGLMTRYDMQPIGMFELAPVGIPIAAAGLLYMFLIGRRLIPERDGEDESSGEFGIRPYLSELLVLPDSPLIGKTLAESRLGQDLDLVVLRVVRENQSPLIARPSLGLRERDVLIVSGRGDDILQVKDTIGIDIKADAKLSMPDPETEERFAEVILLDSSPLVGRTLKQLAFRQRYGLQVLGIRRRGRMILNKMSQVRLKLGDELLIQGDAKDISRLDENNTFRVIGTIEHSRRNLKRAPLAIGIFAAALALATLNVLSLPVAMLLGALIAFVTRCITPDQAYRDVEWKAVIVIGSMLALGSAMEHTGAATFLANGFVDLVGEAHPLWILTAFFVLALLLTQPMSNQAAAVVVVPVAIQTALHLDLNPRTFAIMIAVSASCSFLTPLEPACLMVYGPGRYRFADFLKVGALLTLLIYLLAILIVPSVWPL
jgi:di/tricarboxylate transporter